MSLFKFIFSKTFLIQIGLAIVALVLIAFILLQWLDFTTNQDQRIEVPDLSRMSLKVVEQQLDERDLRFEILDSATFNPDYPKYSVIDQVPLPGKYVKENRKIYLTLNPSGYQKIRVPENLIRKTRRQVEPTLRSLGFVIGDITFKSDISPDAVLELRHKGRLVEPGDELMKTSVIDLVIGDGSGRYGEEVEDFDGDSLPGDDPQNDTNFNDEF